MTRRRRAGTALGCICAGTVALAASLVLPAAAQAAADPGSGFSSFNLAANAPTVQIRFDDGGNCAGKPGGTAGCEGVVPETVSTLRNGPIGYALSSVVWPGVLAGNAGSLLLAANPQTPPEAAMLNSPVRAESRTGTGPDTVTNDDYPGVTMVATAKDDVVSARADIASSAATPLGTFGHTTSATSVKLTGPALAVADARSRADDVRLAGDQLTIGSVTSTVQGTTNGVKATAKGQTVLNDVRIAGIPVTIDDRGITVQDQNNPANATAAAAVNSVVSALGLEVAISQPSGKPEGGKVVYHAGSLVLNWKTEGGTFTAILGGASVALAAAPEGAGFDEGLDLGGGETPLPPAAPTAGGDGGALAPVAGGDVPPAGPDVAPAGGPDVAAPQTDSIAPTLAGQQLPLPGPASPAYLILGLLGAGLLLAGMRSLPDRVLEARAATCLLGESR